MDATGAKNKMRWVRLLKELILLFLLQFSFVLLVYIFNIFPSDIFPFPSTSCHFLLLSLPFPTSALSKKYAGLKSILMN